MIRIEVLRCKGPGEKLYIQSFIYEPLEKSETVATALTRLNEREPLTDADGNEAQPVLWEHSCLQKKCGACAMVINGRPMLACDANLDKLGDVIRLEPLKKFPLVADLKVDRSAMFRNLSEIKAWLDAPAELSENKNERTYEASRCIQCGCCLEVCPNFYSGGEFFGTASAVSASRVLNALPDKEKKEIASNYKKHVYKGCGKSLSCRDICPAKIDIEELMASSNAAAVWKRASH